MVTPPIEPGNRAHCNIVAVMVAAVDTCYPVQPWYFHHHALPHEYIGPVGVCVCYRNKQNKPHFYIISFILIVCFLCLYPHYYYIAYAVWYDSMCMTDSIFKDMELLLDAGTFFFYLFVLLVVHRKIVCVCICLV